MADALTPDQLLQLYQLYQQNGFSTGQNIGGQYLAPVGVQGAGEDNGQNTLQGFTGFDPQMIAEQIAKYGRIMPGTEGSLYGTGGGNSGSYTTQDDNPDGIQKLVLAAIIAASAGAASGAMGGAGGTTVGEAGSTGAYLSPAEMDSALASQTAAGGGVTGGAAAGSVAGGYMSPAEMDSILAEQTAGGGGVTGGAGAASDYGYVNGMDGVSDVATTTGTVPAGTVNAGVGTTMGAGSVGSTIGGAAGGAPPVSTGGSAIPDWAKLLIGGLGAAAGAQGTGDKTTSQKDIPEWLKPMVIGTAGHPGVLGYSQQLLDKQMQPGYLAGYDLMRTNGTQLMNTPQRGNGFNMFYPGMGGGAASAAPAAPVPQPMATPGGWLGGAAQTMPFRPPTQVSQMFPGAAPRPMY